MQKPVSILSALAVCGALGISAVPASGAGKTVRVGDDFFSAKTVRVKKGTTVTWRWVGEERHNVKGKGFRSPVKARGRYKKRFTKRGTFRYVCQLHSDMTGRVIVR